MRWLYNLQVGSTAARAGYYHCLESLPGTGNFCNILVKVCSRLECLKVTSSEKLLLSCGRRWCQILDSDMALRRMLNYVEFLKGCEAFIQVF